MVAGERPRYRTGDPVAHRSRGSKCPDPDCDCGGWVPTPGIVAGPGGAPAHEWYAVYALRYALAGTADGRLTGGICTPAQVLRVRLVSEPGHAERPWPAVPDWLERYTAPNAIQPEDVAP